MQARMQEQLSRESKRRVEPEQDIKRTRRLANQPPQVHITRLTTTTKLHLDQVLQQLQTHNLVLIKNTIAVHRLEDNGYQDLIGEERVIVDAAD